MLYGLYVQDEWRILPTVTINAGLRFDGVDQFTQESQVSPRVNVVWKPTATTTLHAGYARYFVPPPFELVGPNTLTLFSGTTAAPEVTQNDPVKAERSNYFDVGISQVIVPGLTVGIDAYYKISNNLIDEGQFGAPIILTAFNYANGLQEGVEFTGSYDRGPWSIYGNLSVSRAVGKNITSAQFNFGPNELAFIGSNFIHLDHDQKWDGSAGIAYRLNRDSDHPTLFSVDALVQSGLRASTDTIPKRHRAADIWCGEPFDRAEAANTDRTATGRAQCRRQYLPDPQRHRRRCWRVAIRPAPDHPGGCHPAVLALLPIEVHWLVASLMSGLVASPGTVRSRWRSRRAPCPSRRC